MGHYVPHTDDEIRAMLAFCGLDSLDDLYAHIPEAVRLAGGLDMVDGLAEADASAGLAAMAGHNRTAANDLVSFAGYGAYEHELPAAVPALMMRSEFVTSYTPYQPELSQGVLQALFEYQTMVASLYGLEIANASLYDGASAAVEALNLAAAATKRRTVWVSEGVHPNVREVIATLTGPRLDIRPAPLVNGVTVWPDDLGEPAALLVGHPNALGALEDVPAAAALAHDAGALLVASADPVAAGVLRSAGGQGADVAVGEGQPFGTPLGLGGPYLGLFACRDAPWVRRWLPGRLVGETVDANDRRSYVLTLSTREQHIRREKASSNVCTNQTLIAVAAAIHLSWLGPHGLRELATRCVRGAHYARAQLLGIPGVEPAVGADTLYEFPIRLPRPVTEVLDAVAEAGYLGGVDLTTDFPDLGHTMLVSVTETRTREQIDGFAAALEKALS
ncbi:MAG: aminomethyl-transferring glycine dehydrogenase subunit GcvPA [Acidimicrobiia bacterium]